MGDLIGLYRSGKIGLNSLVNGLEGKRKAMLHVDDEWAGTFTEHWAGIEICNAMIYHDLETGRVIDRQQETEEAIASFESFLAIGLPSRDVH